MRYTDESLENLQNIISHAIATADAKYGSLIQSLRESEAVINHDRSVLYPQVSLDEDVAALSGDQVATSNSNLNVNTTDLKSNNVDIL